MSEKDDTKKLQSVLKRNKDFMAALHQGSVIVTALVDALYRHGQTIREIDARILKKYSDWLVNGINQTSGKASKLAFLAREDQRLIKELALAKQQDHKSNQKILHGYRSDVIEPMTEWVTSLPEEVLAVPAPHVVSSASKSKPKKTDPGKASVTPNWQVEKTYLKMIIQWLVEDQQKFGATDAEGLFKLFNREKVEGKFLWRGNQASLLTMFRDLHDIGLIDSTLENTGRWVAQYFRYQYAGKEKDITPTYAIQLMNSSHKAKRTKPSSNHYVDVKAFCEKQGIR